MFVAFALSCVGSLAADAPPSLPSSLPALDDRLLEQPGPPPVTASGAARVRGVVEETDGGDALVGIGFTGRVGVVGDVGWLRGAIVVGEQGWWLGNDGPAQPGPALTILPPAPALLHATLSVPLAVAGLPARLVVGRMTPTVADGRWWGAEPFDARGRTSDGLVLDVDLAAGDAAWALSSGLFAQPAAGGSPAGFATVSHHAGPIDVDVYALGDRAAAPGVADAALAATRGLVGVRARLETGALQLRAGADALAVVDDDLTTARPAWHGEAAFATRLPWRTTSPRPFIDVGVEATGGPARWGTPAPTVHGTMGALDLVDVDNTWQLRAAAGVAGAGADEGLDIVVAWRHVGRLTDARPLSALGGTVVAFEHVDELDVDVVVPVDAGAALQCSWSGAPLSSGFAQRLLVSLSFAVDDDDDDAQARAPAPWRGGPAELAPAVVPGERPHR